MEPNEVLSKIGALAPKVAQEHEEFTQAVAAEQSAKVALLEHVIEAAKPALRALASKITKSYRHWWIDNARGDSEDTFYADRGFCLTDDRQGPISKNTTSFTGVYNGTDVILRVDGSLAEVEYNGEWSNWQGAASSWDSEMHATTAWDLVADDYDVEKLIDRLVTALEKQTGTREKVTKTAIDRAEKLRSIVRLAK